MIIRGMKGLGDNIYQRGFVKQIKEHVYLETPWPELYKDLPHVLPIKPVTTLRTQQKNIVRNSNWNQPVGHHHTLTISYGKEGIIPGMRRTFGIENPVMDLPEFNNSPVVGKYIVVRPVTIRQEWNAETRNPLPEYIYEAAKKARERGYKIVSVADLIDGKEWAIEPLPEADIVYHRGELNVEELLALVQNAAGVIGGIGWIVPACIAAKVPALIVCGGQGGFNSPRQITDDMVDSSHITFAIPDNMCMCYLKIHNCDKRISEYERISADWIGRLPALVPTEETCLPYDTANGLHEKLLA